MTAEPLEVFYSYADIDAPLHDKLITHLAILHQQDIISPWSRQEIRPGDSRAQTIHAHLQTAHIILLLLSPDFFASEYCKIALSKAMERQNAGNATIIPILLRFCNWKMTPIEKLQILPRNEQPVVNWPDKDEAFSEIVKEIRALIEEQNKRRITISFNSVKPALPDSRADYTIDWCDYFVGDTFKKERQLKDPQAWNNQLLPELEALEAQIRQERDAHLIRARGYARLSPWFAFGFVFSQVAGYTIEIDQHSMMWRTDATPSQDFELAIMNNGGSIEGEVLDGEGSSVAVGISISHDLADDVRAYLKLRTDKIAALLLLRPNRALGDKCLRNDSDAMALVDGTKSLMRDFARHWNAKRLLLFYLGPLAGACFLGYKLNAVCPKIQIMDHQDSGYAPSFLLK